MTREHGTRHRALRNLGSDVEVRNYTDDGTRDEYGDATSFSETTTQTKGLIEQSQDPEQVGTAAGEDLEVEVRIFLPDSVNIYPAGEEDGDRPKASVIKDLDTGKRYKVYDDWNDHNGILMTLCRRQE